MRIIALEEHTLDPGIAKATEAAQAVEAGYTADLAGAVEDEPQAFGNRPYMLPVRESMLRAADVGAGRLADMDAHGIDMQVLSYSNAPQLAPAAQGVELPYPAADCRMHGTRIAPPLPATRPSS